MNILTRLEVDILVHDLLPIDDIRHCPKGLRISDIPVRKAGVSRDITKQNYLRRQKEVIIVGYDLFVPSIPEVFRGTYKSAQQKYGILISTLRSAVFTGTTTKKGRYLFKNERDCDPAIS